MTDTDRQPQGFHLQPLTPRQTARVIGEFPNILIDMIEAYVEVAGPNCAADLREMRGNILNGIRNRAPVGLSIEEEPAVIETLACLVRMAFGPDLDTSAMDNDLPDNAGDDLP